MNKIMSLFYDYSASITWLILVAIIAIVSSL